MGSSLKLAALRLGFQAGFFDLFRRIVRRHEAVILAFHRFSGHGDGHPRGMPVETLTEYLDYVTRHYRVVSLRTLTDELSRGVVRRYTAALTVDDGYDDVFTVAAPVLKRYGVPASVFVIGDFIDGRLWPWTDRFGFVFERAPRRPLAFTHGGSVHRLDLREAPARRRAEADWLRHAKRLPVAERDQLLDAIATAAEVQVPVMPPREYRPMTWAQLRTLVAEGWDVGGHTRTHPILSSIGPEQLRSEIDESKARLEQMLGSPVWHFAYPNGWVEDYTPETVAAVARAGYRAAVTIVAGGNTPSTPRYELRRIGADTDGLAHFAQLLCGFEEVKLRMRGDVRVAGSMPRIFGRHRRAPATVGE